MNAEPSLSAADPQRQRDALRQRVLRANTAVAIILTTVLGLALAAVLAGIQARRSQQQAESARAEARHELRRAYLSDLRATRQSDTLNRRSAALETARRAAEIQATDDLRNEAIAALALDDFTIESSFPMPADSTARAFDRSLRWLATGFRGGDVNMTELATGREVRRFRLSDAGIPAAQGNVHGIEFSPDGSRLSARYAGGGIAVWDIATGRTVFQHDTDAGRGAASRPRFAGDGQHLVATVHTPQPGLAVFNLASNQLVASFPEFPINAHAMPRPDAPMFAANDYTNVWVINWQTRERVAHFEFPAGVRRMAWSPDGSQLALGGNTLAVHLWTLATRERRLLTGHRAEVWEIAFDATGRRLASSSFDGTSRIWDARTGRLEGVTDEGYILQFSSGGRIGFERPREALQVRRLTTSSVYHPVFGAETWFDATRILDLSPDGRWAASAVRPVGVAWWNLDGAHAPTLIPIEDVHSVCLHPGQSQLFATHGNEWSAWAVATRHDTVEMERLPNAAAPKRPARFAPVVLTIANDGSRLAVEGANLGCVLMPPNSPQQAVRFTNVTHNGGQRFAGASAHGGGSLALSPDGQRLVCGFNGRAGVTVWDARTGAELAKLSSGEALVQFSPDGRWLALGDESAYRLLRTSDWREVWIAPRSAVSRYAGFLAFAPDSLTLAVVRQRDQIALLDVATGRELSTLEAPDASTIVSLRWSADGRRLVAGTRVNRLDVWDVPALRRELVRLKLDWNSAAHAQAARVAAGPAPAPSSRPAPLALAGLAGVVLVAVVAGLALRQHRRLLGDYARAATLAAERAQQLRVEREMGEIKNSFVSTVSHEFRTPLGVIVSSTDILRRYFDRLDPDTRRSQLDIISRSTGTLSGLIEDLLLLGKVEAGKLACQPVPLDLKTLCRHLVDEAGSATRQTCPIELSVDGDLSGAEGDESLLRPALTNLLTNAIKYSPSGAPVEFHVSRRGDNVEFVIRDRGIGIPEADQARLFAAFSRGTNVGGRPGTGLGLVIAKRCVDLHSGRIEFTSAEDRGTTFTLHVPLFVRNPAPPPPTPS